MKFVFVGYNYDPDFDSPDAWLNKIEGYVGILSCLAVKNEVIRIKQTNHTYNREVNGVQFRFVNFGAKGLRFPWRLHKLIAGMQPDVVVVHGLHNPLQVIQLRLQIPAKTKIIAQNHGEKPWPGVRKIQQRLADRYIDAYLFTSHEMGMDWVNKGNLASSKKIHEVMEISSRLYVMDKVSAKAKTGVSGQPVYLWVGQLIERKNPLTTVKAFLQFARSYPEARLYMVYQNDELLTELKQILNQSSYANAVVLVGKVKHDDLLYWYNSADFMVSGSYHEAAGTAVCEAMSCGCVPILTDIFSFRAVTDNGRCGILYEAGNQQALLATLLQSQQIDAEQMRQDILAHFKSHLSFEAIAKRFEEIAGSL